MRELIALRLGQSLDGWRLDGSAGGSHAGQQSGERGDAEHHTVGSPFEREHGVAVQTKHHVGSEPAEQGTQYHSHHAGDERKQQRFHRSWPRVMPMARKVADSRVRSITDRLSVFATPTKAMSTATAIKPTNNAIMPLIMVSH